MSKNKKITLSVEQTATYNHTIKIINPFEDEENLNSILDDLENDVLGVDLDDIVGELKENGYKVIEVCEDGSPDIENEFDFV